MYFAGLHDDFGQELCGDVWLIGVDGSTSERVAACDGTPYVEDLLECYLEMEE